MTTEHKPQDVSSMLRAEREFALAQMEYHIWQKRDYYRSYPESEKRMERAIAEARKELDERGS